MSENEEEAEVQPMPKKRGFPWFGISFFLLVAAGISVFFTEIPSKINRNLQAAAERLSPQEQVNQDSIALQIEQRLRTEMEERLEQELAVLKMKNTPGSQEVKKPFESLPLGTITDIREMRSGIPLITETIFEKGDIASRERTLKDSFTTTYQLKLRLPKAATQIDELEKSNPGLSKILPGLPRLMEAAEVSFFYEKLYSNKAERLRKNANSLRELLTKHNVYDCETMLEMKSENGRKVFLVQGDMDVVSDGSDGDRLPTMPSSIVDSTHYQPTTSYGWKKQGTTVNPMIAGFERRIAKAKTEMSSGSADASRKKWLKDRVTMLERWISDLKARSYLIAEYDPFIVMPMNLVINRTHPYAPRVGDYAVVIHNGKIYPTIVGDAGPTFKIGEASLRMAKQINKRSSPYSRPVSDLSVTYLVFPGSREKPNRPPNYEEWRKKCEELLGEIGGLGSGYELHKWEDTLPSITPPNAD